MTAAHPFPDDPGPAEAERIAQQWAEQHHRPITEDMAAQWLESPRDYIGRRRAAEDGTRMPAVDERVLRDLVHARVAHYLGNRDLHDHHEQAALLALYDQGHSWATAHALMRQVDAQIDTEALLQLDLMRLEKTFGVPPEWLAEDGQCPDPDRHAVAHHDVIDWLRHRRQTSTCKRCGGRLPTVDGGQR